MQYPWWFTGNQAAWREGAGTRRASMPAWRELPKVQRVGEYATVAPMACGRPYQDRFPNFLGFMRLSRDALLETAAFSTERSMIMTKFATFRPGPRPDGLVRSCWWLCAPSWKLNRLSSTRSLLRRTLVLVVPALLLLA